MRIKIKLFGPLQQHLPPHANGRTAELDLPGGVTVDDLAVRLGIEEEPAVVCVNDQETHRARRLHEGDVVAFFPPLAGG
ncbi:MAG: MoaD/ThiS family protein [Candidatus Latescibacteria bacterium]|nr:MoaD/ThiS family protein [Candidatus Latescibacterota bacterium]